ncbi:Tetratricopeptide repeat protein 28 [Stylophora pistillata]|uniref:Tetratricopeptide repeat protein 28 n=1 Tax=Stylophora pistillata TaxID=50429 RepID=A0A2B4RKY2_STYPI|nr:Tetratricopeptide repeat protein 28 [Stylophora pistillata]
MAENNLSTTGEEVDLDNEGPATATQESVREVTSTVQDDPLRDKAKVCLEVGNLEYRKGQTNEAINTYTEGLQVNCKDVQLNAKLYSNRAAAHFHLGNYEECLSDATVSVQLEPNLMKAITKGANACVKLCLYKEARSWLHTGLAINEGNKLLLDLLSKTNAELKAREGTCCGKLGCAYFRLGQFKTAIEYYQGDLEIAKEVGDKAGEGTSLGQFKTAIGYHQRGLEIAKEVGDKAGEGTSYGNLGCAYGSLGQFKTAIGYHQRGLEIAKEVGNKAGEGRSYNNLGCAYDSLGQFKTGIGYHQRGLEIAKEVGDKAGEGTSYGSLGCAYGSLGQFKTAIGYHQCHLEIAKEVGDKAGEGTSYNNLGWAYGSLGQFKTAIGYHQHCLEIAKEVGDKAGEGTSYANFGCAYFRLGQFKTAIGYHQRHLEIAKEVGDKAEEGKSYGNLGCAYGSLGQFRRAIEYHQRGLEIAEEVGDKEVEAHSLCSLGISWEREGNLMRALDLFHSSVKIYDDIRDSLQFNDKWKICYRNQKKDAYTGLWRIYLSLDEDDKALLAAEKGRAQALRDLMNSKYRVGNYSKCSSPCVSLSCVPSSTAFIAISGPFVYIWVIRSNENVQLRKVHVNNYRYQEELEFFIEQMNRNALKEIGASRDALTGANPPTDSLKEEEGAIDMIRVDVKCSPSKALQKLYDIIITPIADLIVGNELTVVPEGPFCLVPYAALEDSKSTYLSDCLRIRVLPSLTTLRLIDDCPDEFHMKSGALLVGDPCFKHILYQEKLLPQLPGAKKEVEMIGRILNTSPLIREMASKDEVLKRLSSVALVHIASHGKIETGEIILAPNTARENPQPQEIDYLVTMKDVLEAGLRARLVVLSCCHTARGEIMAEGVVGVARAFLGAGARSVVGKKQKLTVWLHSFSVVCRLSSGNYEECLSDATVSVQLEPNLMKAITKGANACVKLCLYKEARNWLHTGLAIDEDNKLLLDLLSKTTAELKAREGTGSPCVSLSCVPSSTVFIAINGPFVYFWIILSNENVQLRKVHVNNYRYQDELEFFIGQMNRDALKEIGTRSDALTGANPQTDSLKEEEVANDMIRVDVKSSQSTALQKLYDIIITPIADLIVGNELTFVPEGPFWLVPYAALEDSKSTYLSDSFTIRLLPSLATLRLINDCPDGFHMKSGALLVGDPCFKHILHQGKPLIQLPGAKKEVAMIGRILNTSPLIREMASKDEVLKRLSSVALVHIASHGKIETGEIILAPNTARENPQPQEIDYLVTMKDVLEAGLRARLVVLSCCHTARGEVMAEGVVGIARAFLGAGARSVVVTLWAIEDEATLEFMNFFYYALVKGKSASEALNEAMKCMRESGNFKEVKQWAPFVLIGDDVRLEMEKI